ncbi:MAG: helix-turn-helix domain-containing protein, partial [Bacteroidota bacterium]
MNQSGVSTPLASISEMLNVDRKTINRNFKKHLNCSWRDYNRLIKFRKAIDLCTKKMDEKTLTQLSLESNYYDQSDFIRHFQSLTGFSPQHFFRTVTNFSDFGTFWTELR